MPDNRDPEIDNTPRKHTAKQEFESLETVDLQNTGYVGEPGSPEGGRGFRDEFDDGVRDSRLYYNGVTEGGGTASISGTTNTHENLLRPIWQYGGRVVVRTRFKIVAGTGGEAKLQLRQADQPSTTSGKIDANGGALVAIRENTDTSWNVLFNWANESGSYGNTTRIDDNNVVEGTYYELRLVADTNKNRFEFYFTDNSSIRYSQVESFSDTDFSGAFTGQVIENNADIEVDWFEIEEMDPPSPALSFRPRSVNRVIGTEAVTNPPVSTPLPKEPAGVKVGDTYYCAVACWDGYAGSQTSKGVALFESTNPFGGWRQISRLHNSPTDKWHAPAVVYDVEGNGNLWVLVNNQDQRHSQLYYADENSLPSEPSGWNTHGPILDDGLLDTKGVIKHDGDWYVASMKYNSGGSSRETVLDKGSDLRSLSRVGSISNQAPQGPDLFPSGDGRWAYVDSSSGGFNGTSGWFSQVAVADSIDGTYTFGGLGRARKFSGPGAVYDQGLDDSAGWYNDWTAHFHMVKNEAGTGLAKHRGHYIQLFEGGDGYEYAVGATAVPANYGGELVDSAMLP